MSGRRTTGKSSLGGHMGMLQVLVHSSLHRKRLRQYCFCSHFIDEETKLYSIVIQLTFIEYLPCIISGSGDTTVNKK